MVEHPGFIKGMISMKKIELPLVLRPNVRLLHLLENENVFSKMKPFTSEPSKKDSLSKPRRNIAYYTL